MTEFSQPTMHVCADWAWMSYVPHTTSCHPFCRQRDNHHCELYIARSMNKCERIFPEGQTRLRTRCITEELMAKVRIINEKVTSPRHSATAVNPKQWGMSWMSARWLASTVASQNYTKHMMRPSTGCWDNTWDHDKQTTTTNVDAPYLYWLKCSIDFGEMISGW